MVGVSTNEVKGTFNSSGQVQGLSFSLNRTVTLKDFVSTADAATQTKLGSLVSALNALEPGLGERLAAANLYSDFSIRQQVMLFAFEYGVNDRLSIGARIPLVKRSARNRFSVTPVNNAGLISAEMGALSTELSAGLQTIAKQSLDTAFFENALFTSKGYEPPRDFEKTQLGDLEMGAKYNFYRDDIFHSTALVGVGLPTGAKSDLRNVFDKGNSKEAFCYGLQLFQEAEMFRGFTLGGAAKMSFSLPDTRERAVPRDANDSMPSLLPEAGQVQSVKRNRGAQFETELSSGYRFLSDKFGIWAAYQYSEKAKDRYSGQGNLYYQGLADGSDWKLHAGEVGGEYSTIPAFRRGTFPVPMEVSLLYNKALRGINTSDASYLRMDVMVYF